MVWEEFLNKKVQVKQADGFIKYGTLKEITEEFVVLQFNDGSGKNIISKGFILSLVEDLDG